MKSKLSMCGSPEHTRDFGKSHPVFHSRRHRGIRVEAPANLLFASALFDLMQLSNHPELLLQAGFLDIASPDRPFEMTGGGSLRHARLAYETYGKLNADKSNAILLFHALSGSQHAAGIVTSVPHTGNRWTDDCQRGWWDLYIGPGKVLDTRNYFVICANYLGGCYGTSGPASTNPETGQPYAASFPAVSTVDVVRSQAALLDHFGIDQLLAVIGPSVGGLLAINFATLYPERVRIVIPIAAGPRTTVLTRLTLFEQVLAIENDPHFNGGDFYHGPAPEYGLALARMISHKTFVHLDAIERRARNDVVQRSDQLAWYRVRNNVESYMLHQGKKFVKRFDANTYLRIADMWLQFDPLAAAGVGDYTALFEISARAGHHYLIFSIDSDFCFYPEEQSELTAMLETAGASSMMITVHSSKGHDSFLLEPELYAPHLHYTLQGRWQKASVDLPLLRDVE
jgi:homoserine O-acetyltransferase